MGQVGHQPSFFEIESDKPLNKPDCLTRARRDLLSLLPSFYRHIAEMVLEGTWFKKSEQEQEDGEENPVKQALTDVITEGSTNRFVFWVSRTVSPIPGRRRRGSKEYKEGGGALEGNRVVRFVGSREQWLFTAWNAGYYLYKILQGEVDGCKCGEDCQKIKNERDQLRLPYEYAISQLADALVWRYGTEVHKDFNLWERIIFPLQFPIIRPEILSFIGFVGARGSVYLFPRIFEMAGGIPVDKKDWREQGREYLKALRNYTKARINYFFKSREPARGVPFPDVSVEAVEFKGPYLPITAIPLLETWLGYCIVTTNWPVVADKVAPFGLMKNLLVIAATSNSTWLLDIVKDWEERVTLMQAEQGDEITASILAEMKCILEGVRPFGQFDDLSLSEVEW